MLLDVFFLFFLGLCFGSFVSALSWRIPKGISFTKGRSICPKCKKEIAWYDNIPLISYLLLSGKCRNCSNKISFRYPLIEFTSGLGFALIYSSLKSAGQINYLQLIFLLTLFVILLSIFVIDMEQKIIPDSLVFSGIFVALAYLGIFKSQVLPGSIVAGLIAASFLMVVYIATKGRGMGLGDVKFAVLGGLIIGLTLSPIWLLLSFTTGAIAGIFLIFLGKAKLKSEIAFGPFLILGVALTLLYGNNIIRMLGF